MIKAQGHRGKELLLEIRGQKWSWEFFYMLPFVWHCIYYEILRPWKLCCILWNLENLFSRLLLPFVVFNLFLSPFCDFGTGATHRFFIIFIRVYLLSSRFSSPQDQYGGNQTYVTFKTLYLTKQLFKNENKQKCLEPRTLRTEIIKIKMNNQLQCKTMLSTINKTLSFDLGTSCKKHVIYCSHSKKFCQGLLSVLRQFPPRKIVPNHNSNPNPNFNLNRGAIFLGGNCPDTAAAFM